MTVEVETRGIHALFNDPGLRRLLLSVRKPLGLAVAVAVLLNADRAWFVPGLIVSFLGAAGQWWCFACIDTQKVLAINGPYSWMSNPMYVTRYFLILGGLMFLGNVWLLLVFTVVYYLYMYNRVRREESKLSRVLGPDYREYREAVNRFLPTIPPFEKGKKLYWSYACFSKNHGLTNMAAVLLFYGLAYYYSYHYDGTGWY